MCASIIRTGTREQVKNVDKTPTSRNGEVWLKRDARFRQAQECSVAKDIRLSVKKRVCV